MKQYSKMTKASLVRKIMKALKKMPKTKLVKLCYQLEKKKLPKITTMQKSLPNPDFFDKLQILPTKKMSENIFSREKEFMELTSKVRDKRRARSAKQRANDKRLGLMAKRRARVRRFGSSGARVRRR